MHAPGIWGIIVVAIVVILLFGRGKIAGLMGEVASGIKSFQKGMRDDDTQQRIDTASKMDATTAQAEKAKDV